MADETDIRRILWRDRSESTDRRRTRSAVQRAKRQLGQRDTLAFVFIRIWAALARMLAPIFVAFGERQARAIHEGKPELGRDEAGPTKE